LFRSEGALELVVEVLLADVVAEVVVAVVDGELSSSPPQAAREIEAASAAARTRGLRNVMGSPDGRRAPTGTGGADGQCDVTDVDDGETVSPTK
jgi:hypothetical protein